MKRLAICLFTGLTLGLGAGASQARECKGATFPEQVQSGGATLTLNGLGLRQATFLKVNVYVAALYVAATSGEPGAILGSNTAKELVLHFVRDVDRSDLNKAWDEGFEHNAGDGLPALRARIDSFKALMADMKTGQRLRFADRPGAGVQVDVDGKDKGSIAGDDFARALFSIWLGAHPPNAGLKAGLLGGACG